MKVSRLPPGLEENLTVVEIGEKKICDFCNRTASYDAKTRFGYWAYMCGVCFKRYGIGLGLGRGQRLIVKNLSNIKANESE